MSRDYVQIARRFAAAPWVLALPVGVFVAAAILWGLGLDSEGAGVTAIAATVFTIWVALRSESRAADRHHQQSHMELRELRYRRIKELVELGETGDATRRAQLIEYADNDLYWLNLRIAKQTLLEEGSTDQVDPSAIKQAAPPRDLAESLRISSGFTSDLDADGWLRRGNAYLRGENWPRAVAAFDSALAIRADDPVAVFNRGYALAQAGRYAEALAAYDRGLDLRPDDPGTLTNRGATLGRLGRHEEALADFDRSLELRPDHPDAHYNRGCLLAQLGRRDDAFSALRRAVEFGFAEVEHPCSDPDLKVLRDDPRFPELFDCSDLKS